MAEVVFVILSFLSISADETAFSDPVRLQGGSSIIQVEAPGYACPSFFDVDGDGKKDLIVGQFKKGYMKLYRNLGDQKFGAGEWIMADGKVAEVPGVW